ncbi:MAG: xanthine dehydrogenase family protein subunit M [Chloroflexota bacterium]|nr:MAG: xanthine dehydrogenase family protein subunit M [Chloroflexota bacterium]
MASYLRPAELPAALEALAQGVAEGRPRVVVAGATDHYPARVGRVTDEDVLDVSALAAFRGIREVEGGWWIAAGATWTQLAEQPLPACFDGLQRAAVAIGGLQIQNRATIAGNVCNASPAADGVPNLLVLDAVVELASVRGARRVPVGEFVVGNRATVRAPDELVTGLFVPDPAAAIGAAAGAPGRKDEFVASSTFLKLGARAYLVISIAMVAAVVVRDAGRRIASARLAVGACSPVARRLPTLEAELAGRTLEPGIGDLVRADHLTALSPIDDVRGTAGYRRASALVLVRRALEELAS